MSNAIRFDALLLAALATELRQRLAGARLAAAWLDRTRRVLALELGEKRAPHTLSWNLHPTAGQIALRAGTAAERGALLQVRRGARITDVRSVPDERVLRLELDAADAAAGVVRAIVVELIGNRWNALALGEGEVITAALVQRRDGARELRPGVPYSPPLASARLGVAALPARAEWHALLRGLDARARTRALLAGVAWTSPLNAGWILGAAGEHDDVGAHVLDEAYDRYAALRTDTPQPHLLGAHQPYIRALTADALPLPSLLEAFERAAASAALPALGQDALRERVRVRLHERESRIGARAERLREEAEAARAEAAAARAQGDILLARLHQVPRGAAEAELEDFAGERVRIALDPALSPQHNAERLYEQAKKRARAAARAPVLRARAEAELERVRALRARVESGELSGGELAALAARTERPAQALVLPYRRYRTSGGLEVRVGRSAKANDALTGQHAAPEDIWLHARDVGGAHVILRWGKKTANPPRADLVEAAVLAALFSRARTSGTVPVDWTRRKYVRKRRKAAPGLVVPERVSTLFVEPDAAVAERLRVDEEELD